MRSAQRYVVGLVLAAIACSAVAAKEKANWTKVATEKNADIFVDLASIRLVDLSSSNRGKVVKMSHLRNYRTPQPWGTATYLSEKYVAGYDCERTRSGQFVHDFRVGPMDTGSRFNYGSTSGPPMKPVAPGTLEETLWKIACGKSAAR